jgi:hypothetical protein
MTSPESNNNMHILDLDEVVEAPQARINGTLHDLRTPETFTMEESMKLRRLSRQLQRAMRTVDDVDSEDDAALDSAMKFLGTVACDMLAYIVPSLSKEEREDLAPEKQQRILNFFMKLNKELQDSLPESSPDTLLPETLSTTAPTP